MIIEFFSGAALVVIAYFWGRADGRRADAVRRDRALARRYGAFRPTSEPTDHLRAPVPPDRARISRGRFLDPTISPDEIPRFLEDPK